MYICEKWAPKLLGDNIEDKAMIVMLRDLMTDFYDSIINKAINDNHCKQFDAKQEAKAYQEELAKFALDGIKQFVDYLRKATYLVGN